jgi:hypothetical protein
MPHPAKSFDSALADEIPIIVDPEDAATVANSSKTVARVPVHLPQNPRYCIEIACFFWFLTTCFQNLVFKIFISA